MSLFLKNILYLRRKNNISLNEIAEHFELDVEIFENIEGRKAFVDPKYLLILAEYFNFSLTRLINEDLEAFDEKVQKFDCKFIATDIDGVMTDGGLMYNSDGSDSRRFNVKDGYAIIRLRQAGFNVGFISSGKNKNILKNRAEHLNVEYVSSENWSKLECLKNWCNELGINLNQVAYIGDDHNDLEVIKAVGLSACPSDAANIVKESVNIILESKGGEGVIREFTEKYLYSLY